MQSSKSLFRLFLKWLCINVNCEKQRSQIASEPGRTKICNSIEHDSSNLIDSLLKVIAAVKFVFQYEIGSLMNESFDLNHAINDLITFSVSTCK